MHNDENWPHDYRRPVPPAKSTLVALFVIAAAFQLIGLLMSAAAFIVTGEFRTDGGGL